MNMTNNLGGAPVGIFEVSIDRGEAVVVTRRAGVLTSQAGATLTGRHDTDTEVLFAVPPGEQLHGGYVTTDPRDALVWAYELAGVQIDLGQALPVEAPEEVVRGAVAATRPLVEIARAAVRATALADLRASGKGRITIPTEPGAILRGCAPGALWRAALGVLGEADAVGLYQETQAAGARFDSAVAVDPLDEAVILGLVV